METSSHSWALASRARLSCLSGCTNQVARFRSSLDTESLAIINGLAGSSNANDLDMAAQLLADKVGPPTFDACRASSTGCEPEQAMRHRLTWLGGIPFSAIVTANATIC